MRHLTTAEDIFAALVEHIEVATNRAKIRPNLFFQSAAWHRENLSSLEQLGRQCPFHI